MARSCQVVAAVVIESSLFFASNTHIWPFTLVARFAASSTMRRGGGQLRCDKKTATFAAVFFVAFYVLVLRNVGGTGLHTVRPLVPHAAAPAPPAPTPVRTVGNITGGTSPLDKGTCQAPAPPVGDLRGMAQPTIHVFVPNFYNDALVVSNIRNMQARQRTPDVMYVCVLV